MLAYLPVGPTVIAPEGGVLRVTAHVARIPSTPRMIILEAGIVSKCSGRLNSNDNDVYIHALDNSPWSCVGSRTVQRLPAAADTATLRSRAAFNVG